MRPCQGWVQQAAKKTSPPAVRKPRRGWGLLVTSDNHHLNHATSLSCLIKSSWFTVVSPLFMVLTWKAVQNWRAAWRGGHAPYALMPPQVCMGILGPVADQVKELGRLCPVWENRHSYQSIIAPFLLPENLQQKNVDVDAVLNQSYKTLLSSPNWWIALKRSMFLLRFPPFWTRGTKLSQIASVVPSLDVENVKIPLGRNVLPKACE